MYSHEAVLGIFEYQSFCVEGIASTCSPWERAFSGVKQQLRNTNEPALLRPYVHLQRLGGGQRTGICVLQQDSRYLKRCPHLVDPGPKRTLLFSAHDYPCSPISVSNERMRMGERRRYGVNNSWLTTMSGFTSHLPVLLTIYHSKTASRCSRTHAALLSTFDSFPPLPRKRFSSSLAI